MTEQERIARLFDCISYEPLTGDLIWKRYVNSKTTKGGKVGRVYPDNKGKKYVRLTLDRKNYYAHRVAWLIFYGKFPDGCIDHIDGDGTNNRICNLRDVTAQENSRNAKLNDRNKTGVCGVSFRRDKMKYEAKIKLNNKTVNLIATADFFLAVCARKSAERRYGFHENHGSDRPKNPSTPLALNTLSRGDI